MAGSTTCGIPSITWKCEGLVSTYRRCRKPKGNYVVDVSGAAVSVGLTWTVTYLIEKQIPKLGQLKVVGRQQVSTREAIGQAEKVKNLWTAYRAATGQ